MERRKIIIDCDAGTDDALAIMILIAAHKTKQIEIKGITCVHGNTSLENVIKNVCRTLHVCECEEIPVFKGAYSPLMTVHGESTGFEKFHGEDGFGDIYKDEFNTKCLQEDHAVFALQKIVSKSQGEISIICLGPLTNIALAIKTYPEFIDNVKEFFIMGGNSFDAEIEILAEFNFRTDPESVHIFLKHNKKPLWLLPWETCTKCRISLNWRKETFGGKDAPCIKLLNDIEHKVWDIREERYEGCYIPCDAILAACFLKPYICKNISTICKGVILEEKNPRGQLIFDTLLSNNHNMSIIHDFDSEVFKEILLSFIDQI